MTLIPTLFHRFKQVISYRDRLTRSANVYSVLEDIILNWFFQRVGG